MAGAEKARLWMGVSQGRSVDIGAIQRRLREEGTKREARSLLQRDPLLVALTRLGIDPRDD